MDLDTIIPIVIVAVAYLYRAFEESRKKGKEKEAQQEQGRPLPGPDKTSRRPRVPTPNAAPVPLPHPFRTPHPFRPPAKQYAGCRRQNKRTGGKSNFGRFPSLPGRYSLRSSIGPSLPGLPTPIYATHPSVRPASASR